jgi:hypothetical protein
MRWITRGAGVVLLVSAAAAAAAPPAAGAEGDVTLNVNSERRVPIVGGEPGVEGRTVGYWGKFTFALDTMRTGSYRATCSWLAPQEGWTGNTAKRDNRILCTLVLSFRAIGGAADPLGTTLIAQGLMLRPKHKEGLFTRASDRRLPITGASGLYKGKQGVVFAQSIETIRIEFDG